MLVVDSSVVVKWFVDEPLHAEARHIYKYQQDILAPEFVLVEVANVVWKKVRRKEIGADQAYEIINLAIEALPGFIHSPTFWFKPPSLLSNWRTPSMIACI